MVEIGGLAIDVRESPIHGDTPDETHSAWSVNLIGASGRACILNWCTLRSGQTRALCTSGTMTTSKTVAPTGDDLSLNQSLATLGYGRRLMGTGDKARRHTMLELFRGATISRGRAWNKPHFVPLGTPHRRKRCYVQRLAARRAATPGIGRPLHRAAGQVRPASKLHRDLPSVGRTFTPSSFRDSRLSTLRSG